jgi:4-hydroxybenzoate polyprenyltransferase
MPTQKNLESPCSRRMPSMLGGLSDAIRVHLRNDPVLCVDLDGTLIKSDLLWECVVLLLKTKPLCLFAIPYWILRGRAHVKKQLAIRSGLKPSGLPYRTEVVQFLRSERASGRRLVLTTASDRRLAQAVADDIGVFDEIYASDGKMNLKGKTKAAFLRERFAKEGFEYIGDSRADLEVWRAAKTGYVVGDDGLVERAANIVPIRTIFPQTHVSLKTWVQALRGHHWIKNILLFVPLALAHRLTLSALLLTTIGFVLFGICASGLYILNDLLDLHSDRGHPWKHKRPFAAGDIPISRGLMMAFLLLGGALSAAFLLEAKFGMTLCGYVMLTIWYSTSLKKIVLLDVFVLSSFYGVRLLAGALVTSVPLSQWFLIFSLFFFLSLAMAKRYSELVHAVELVKNGQSGRGYVGNDRDVLLALGVASSFAAVIILSLYVHSPEVGLMYRSPARLLLLCPIILYWFSRLWLKAHRGDLHDDPITLAIRDPVSYAVAGFSAVVISVSGVGF